MKPRMMIAVLIGAGCLAGLVGCVAAPPSTTQNSPTAPSSPAPAVKTAIELKHALFDETNLRTSRGSAPTGAAFLAGLAAAGFAADSLEVTTDVTSVGLTAPSLQFAALVDSICLIGQYGPDGTGYRSIAVAPITTGRCLIGTPSRQPTS